MEPRAIGLAEPPEGIAEEESATPQFSAHRYGGFDTLAVDAGSNWTMTGSETVPTILNNGTISVTGALDVSTAVDPTSSGIFQLTANGSSLEVAADAGAASQIQFLGSSKVIADNFSSFGTGIGTSSASGPLLESFGSGDSVDLRQFNYAPNLTLDFNTSSGLLKVSNGSQTADLSFQTASLGSGTFQATSDLANGVIITHS